MIVYIYDNDFLFSGPIVPQINPKKPAEFLLPANSTEIAPPEDFPVDTIPKYDVANSTWSLITNPAKIAQDEALAEAEALAQKAAEEAQKLLDQANEEKVNDDGVLLYEVNADGSVTLRPEQDVLDEVAAKLALAALEAIKKTMDINILTKARAVTLGTSAESMQAFTQAFTLRAQNPAEYVADNLVAHYATAGYALGSVLDTELKITEYYTKIMIELDKFRNAEIATYLAAKAAL